MLWGGKELQDGKTLETYGIQQDNTLHLVYKLHGGLS